MFQNMELSFSDFVGRDTREAAGVACSQYLSTVAGRSFLGEGLLIFCVTSGTYASEAISERVKELVTTYLDPQRGKRRKAPPTPVEAIAEELHKFKKEVVLW